MPEIELPGTPIPKARPRLGRGGRVFTPRSTQVAEHWIRETWERSGFGRMDGAVYVEVRVRLVRPRGHFGARGLLPSAPRWPAVRPDLDNYAKTALDALRGVAFTDDGQVVRCYLAKTYAREDEAPGWRIGVYVMEDEHDRGDPARDGRGGPQERQGPADLDAAPQGETVRVGR